MLSAEELTIIRLSLQVALVSVVISLPVAVAVAYLLARVQFAGKSVVDALVHLPLVVPPVVIGLALLTLFGRQGPVGALLEQWFDVVLAFRWTGAALAAAVMGFPLTVRAVRLSFEAIDTRLETAAHSLGASRMDTFVWCHHHVCLQHRRANANLALGDLLRHASTGWRGDGVALKRDRRHHQLAGTVNL
jgi:molybdate transport system permease protein